MQASRVPKICHDYGFSVRKHIDEIHSWTARVPTVVDLDADEREALDKQGPGVLSRLLADKGCFSVPALDLMAPRRIERETCIVRERSPAAALVCSPDSAASLDVARVLQKTLRQATGVELPILSDQTVTLEAPVPTNLILVGGSHQNRLSRQLAYQAFGYADRRTPGTGGYLVHTLHGLYAPGANVIVVAADRAVSADVAAVFMQALSANGPGQWELSRLHAAQPGRDLQAELTPPEQVLRAVLPAAPHIPSDSDPGSAEFREYVRFLYDSGGAEVNRYNSYGAYAAVQAFHAYCLTGDRTFLRLCKAFFWGLVDYQLTSPGGASYISDIDFPAGNLVTTWSLAEADPLFTESERLLITATLLALLRQVAKYKEAQWPTPPAEMRHNHETFPALSLWRGARYFGDFFDVPDVHEWRAVATGAFSGPIANVFKHTENANGYQWFVPMHKLMYDVSSGTSDAVNTQALALTAQCVVAAIDNFGAGVDYGDSHCQPGTGFLGAVPFLELAAGIGGDGTLAWVAEFVRAATRQTALMSVPRGGQGLLGCCTTEPGPAPPCGAWEILPLDDHIRQLHQPEMPRKYVADKIGFRNAWTPAAQFLLFEPYSVDSHCHFDMNAILRYNQDGRVWLVDNNYGKPSGEANVARSFNARQRGPEDHNLVIFRGTDGAAVIPPPFAAVLALKASPHALLLQSALAGIEGAAWLRSILLFRGRGMLVLDQVRASGSETNIECQYNALGKDRFVDSKWYLEQQGRSLVLQVCPGHEIQVDQYTNQGWDAVLGGRQYPYAPPGVRKLRQVCTAPETGQRIVFAALICATDNGAADLELVCPGGGAFEVRGANLGAIELAGHDLAVASSPAGVAVQTRETWALPDGLDEEMFGACGLRPSYRDLARKRKARASGS